MVTTQKYYINNDTNEILTRDEFLDIMYEYIDTHKTEDNEKLTVYDIECNFDDILHIGEFTNKTQAKEYYENER